MYINILLQYIFKILNISTYTSFYCHIKRIGYDDIKKEEK